MKTVPLQFVFNFILFSCDNHKRLLSLSPIQFIYNLRITNKFGYSTWIVVFPNDDRNHFRKMVYLGKRIKTLIFKWISIHSTLNIHIRWMMSNDKYSTIISDIYFNRQNTEQVCPMLILLWPNFYWFSLKLNASLWKRILNQFQIEFLEFDCIFWTEAQPCHQSWTQLICWISILKSKLSNFKIFDVPSHSFWFLSLLTTDIDAININL